MGSATSRAVILCVTALVVVAWLFRGSMLAGSADVTNDALPVVVEETSANPKQVSETAWANEREARRAYWIEVIGAPNIHIGEHHGLIADDLVQTAIIPESPGGSIPDGESPEISTVDAPLKLHIDSQGYRYLLFDTETDDSSWAISELSIDADVFNRIVGCLNSEVVYARLEGIMGFYDGMRLAFVEYEPVMLSVSQ